MSYNKTFYIYKSSAGSGKTYTLVKEYLKLALAKGQKDYYKYILAITFTNKAAEEMKARVLVCLSDISKNLPDNHKNFALQQSLCNELNISLNTLQNRAEEVLLHMLHHYSDIAISTIDKFTHRIIRTFAHDLNLPLNFEVEMDTDRILNEAVEILISKVGEDRDMTAFLLKFAEAKVDDDKSWNIENDILNFSKNLLKEENEYFFSKLKNIDIHHFSEIIKNLRERKSAFEQRLKNIGKKAFELIKQNYISNDTFYQGINGIGNYFMNLSELKKILPNKYVLTTINEDKWFSSKASKEQIQKIETIKSDLISYYNEVQEAITEKYAEYLLINDLLKNIHSTALLQELENILSQIKSEQNILPISEFNKRISVIVQNESAPFIYERIGEKYHHFLIDEFQDTSIMQWQNLLPLIHNALSGGYFNMIVGDGKQSIYRWRGGEVEQFDKLPKIFSKQPLTPILKEREKAIVENYDIKILEENWRSKKEIIQFNNDFFRFLSDNYLGEFASIYSNLEQKFKEHNSGAWITCDIVKNKKGNSEIDEVSAIQKSLELTLNYILKHLELGYSQRDICILCRKNEQGQIVADYLIKNNLNVISADSLLLAGNSKVQLILNILNYAIQPKNKVAQVKILEYLFNNKIVQYHLQEELFLKISNGEQSIESILKSFNIQFSKSSILQQSLYDAVEGVIRLFNLNAVPDPYIQFFLNAVFEFSTKKNNSIHDFLDWFNAKSNTLSIVIPEGSDAIQVMTIHKSKGLEFPVVIIPFANERIVPSSNVLWVDIPEKYKLNLPVGLIASSGQEENHPFYANKLHEKSKTNLDIINLLYVAFTRAVDALHIILTEENRTDNTFSWFYNFFTNKFDFNLNDNYIEISPLNSKIKLHHKDKKETVTFTQAISSHWYEKLQLSTTAPQAWNIDNPDQASQYGKYLHEIIASINHKNEVDEVLEKFIFEGNITDIDAQEIKSEIKKIVSHPLLSKFFTNEYIAINEAEIIDDKGNSFRPDKIFIKNNEAVILDFKTGIESESHQLQIKQYAKLLQNLGYTVSEKYLCYTQTGRVINV